MAIPFFIPNQARLIAAYANSDSSHSNNNSDSSNNINDSSSSVSSNSNSSFSSNCSENLNEGNANSNGIGAVSNQTSDNSNSNSPSMSSDSNNNSRSAPPNLCSNLSANGASHLGNQLNWRQQQQQTYFVQQHTPAAANVRGSNNGNANNNNSSRSFWRRVLLPVQLGHSLSDANNNTPTHYNYNCSSAPENYAARCWGICVQGFWYALGCYGPGPAHDDEEELSETRSTGSADSGGSATPFDIFLEVKNHTTQAVTIAAEADDNGIHISVEFEDCFNCCSVCRCPRCNGIRRQPTNV